MSGFGESGRVASLDALRGGAEFAVAIAHYLAYRGIGPFRAEAASALAVEIFFTLSGFVLAPQIIRCVRDGSLATLKVFLVRRWMRTVSGDLRAAQPRLPARGWTEPAA